MQKDNTSTTFFARNTIVNTDQNFAESGSFWYQLLKGKTKAAAKTMSKLPMLTNMASEVQNKISNITNNPKNIYLVNKEYNFKLDDLQLYFTVYDNYYVKYCKADKDSLKNFKIPSGDLSPYSSGRVFLKIPLTNSLDIDFLNSDILCIRTFTKELIEKDESFKFYELKSDNGKVYLKGLKDYQDGTSGLVWSDTVVQKLKQTSKNVLYPYVDFTQKDDSLFVALNFLVSNLQELFELDNQGKSDFIDAIYNIFAKDAVTGGFIFNAKYFGGNNINKSIYNSILSLHNIPIGQPALQAAEYIKGSNQTIENFGKTLNAMYRGIAVDEMCKQADWSPDNVDYEDSLNNIPLIIGPEYNQKISNLISRARPTWETSKVFYPGDYYVSPIKLHYNNDKDLWWDPLKAVNSSKTLWTTDNSPVSDSYGLMYSEIANYGKSNTQTVDLITYDNHPLSNGRFTLNKPSEDFALRWDDEKLKTVLTYYEADNQLGWFFKYIVPHAIIVDINLDMLIKLYPDLNLRSSTPQTTVDFGNLLGSIKKDALNLCPIGNLLIFRASHYGDQWYPSKWRELDCYITYGELNFS